MRKKLTLLGIALSMTVISLMAARPAQAACIIIWCDDQPVFCCHPYVECCPW